MNDGLSIDGEAAAWGRQSERVTEQVGGRCGLTQAQVLVSLPQWQLLSSNKHRNKRQEQRCALGRVCVPREGWRQNQVTRGPSDRKGQGSL